MNAIQYTIQCGFKPLLNKVKASGGDMRFLEVVFRASSKKIWAQIRQGAFDFGHKYDKAYLIGVIILNSHFIIGLAEQGIMTVLAVSLPLLLLALVVGLIVSIFQATTQIQEQTLAFIPKIIAVLAGLIFFGPWMLSRIVDYTFQIFNNLYKFVG